MPLNTDMNFCTYCKSSNSKALYPTKDIFDNHYEINSCKNCKAIFLNPQPDNKLLAQAYDETYYGTQEDKFNPIIERIIDLFRYGRAKRLTKGLPNQAKILDIGCGNGKFLQYLLKFGNFELYGSELPGNSANRAATIKEIKLSIGRIEDNDYKKDFFDAITLFHVFEHLQEPELVLDKIKTILKKNGKLVMSFPNINSAQSKVFKGKWLHLDPPRHLFFFKPNDFISLMQKKGLVLQKAKYLSLEQNPFGMIQSTLNSVSSKRELLFEMLKGNKIYLNDTPVITKLLHLFIAGLLSPFAILSDIVFSTLKKGATVELTFINK